VIFKTAKAGGPSGEWHLVRAAGIQPAAKIWPSILGNSVVAGWCPAHNGEKMDHAGPG
jgi:hypothetical protein